MTREQKAALQRAGIMGAVVAILRTEEATLQEIKHRLTATFAMMIEVGATVEDVIDKEVADACRDYLIQEEALKEVKEMFN